MPASHRLKCAETWAGNHKIASLVELPGLAAWVHSVPAGPGEAGGVKGGGKLDHRGGGKLDHLAAGRSS